MRYSTLRLLGARPRILYAPCVSRPFSSGFPRARGARVAAALGACARRGVPRGCGTGNPSPPPRKAACEAPFARTRENGVRVRVRVRGASGAHAAHAWLPRWVNARDEASRADAARAIHRLRPEKPHAKRLSRARGKMWLSWPRIARAYAPFTRTREDGPSRARRLTPISASRADAAHCPRAGRSALRSQRCSRRSKPCGRKRLWRTERSRASALFVFSEARRLCVAKRHTAPHL